ncbi:MAG: hypothetical protein U5K30_01435 [Acidimicrobiales bacterium]|nr:hypothetical protein [Acidimicrobiales bacterium]
MANVDRFLTTEDLAERWHTTPAGILNQRHRGNAPRGYRLGKRVLFKLTEVEAFEAKRADDPQPTA